MPRTTMLALVAGLALAADQAVAEVTLATEVVKVETTLDAGGRVKRQLIPAESVIPGEELRYTITFTNESEALVDGGRIVITNPVPDGTRYVPGSAGGEAALVEFSRDGESFDQTEPAAESASPAPAQAGAAATMEGVEAVPDDDGSAVHSIRWTYQEDLQPGASAVVFFHVRML